MKKILTFALGIFLLFLVILGTASAASISGHINEFSGGETDDKPLGNAYVDLFFYDPAACDGNGCWMWSRGMFTDFKGHFSFSDLAIGIYYIESYRWADGYFSHYRQIYQHEYLYEKKDILDLTMGQDYVVEMDLLPCPVGIRNSCAMSIEGDEVLVTVLVKNLKDRPQKVTVNSEINGRAARPATLTTSVGFNINRRVVLVPSGGERKFQFKIKLPEKVADGWFGIVSRATLSDNWDIVAEQWTGFWNGGAGGIGVGSPEQD